MNRSSDVSLRGGGGQWVKSLRFVEYFYFIAMGRASCLGFGVALLQSSQESLTICMRVMNLHQIQVHQTHALRCPSSPVVWVRLPRNMPHLEMETTMLPPRE